MGLKLFRFCCTSGVLYLPIPALTAVLWLPNTSYTPPRRGDQSLKQETPLSELQSINGKLRAGTNRPPGAVCGLMSLFRYSQRRPAVMETRLNVQVSCP